MVHFELDPKARVGQFRFLISSSSQYLKWFLAGVHELVALQLGALDEGLAALGAHVHPGPVRVEVLPHCAGGGKLG